MNKIRREALGKIREIIEAASSELENLQDEEQEYFDNMPESLKLGEKGETAENAVTNLGSAVDDLEQVLNSIDEATA